MRRKRLAGVLNEDNENADADGGDNAVTLVNDNAVTLVDDNAVTLVNDDEDATVKDDDANSDGAEMLVDDDEIINGGRPCFTEDRAADDNSLQYDGDVDGDEIIDDWLMMLMAGALTRDEDGGDHGDADDADADGRTLL